MYEKRSLYCQCGQLVLRWYDGDFCEAEVGITQAFFGRQSNKSDIKKNRKNRQVLRGGKRIYGNLMKKVRGIVRVVCWFWGGIMGIFLKH